MLLVTAVSGNVHDGAECPEPEHLLVSRTDLEKGRLRRQTDAGTDVGISLDPGITLRDGDVLAGGSRPIIVRQEPEKVISVRLDDPGTGVLAGHIIGNRHRPIALEDGAIYFPIQADSELEVFERLLAPAGARLAVEERVFVPHGGTAVHGH